jgi:glycosyltransferase involved in cell wall biosynthesis
VSDNQKKRILIDLERLKYVHTGLGQVCLNFGHEIACRLSDRFDITLLVPRVYAHSFGEGVRYETVTIWRKYFPFLFSAYDLWYAIHQDSNYFPSNSKTPYVLTVHDLNFMNEKSPKKAKKRLKRLKRRTERAIRITTISEFTRSQLTAHITSLETKLIKVIYNGIEVKDFPDAPRPDYITEQRFLFSLGVIRPKKNQKVLIEFIKTLDEDTVLVLAGNKEGWYAKEIEDEITFKNLSKRVIMPGEISDQDKSWLYRNAYAVVFPSLYEGMGMPPIEAMRYGKPVFVSKSSSIPEICKEHAYYWENFDPDEMAVFFREKTEQFYSDPINSQTIKNYAERFRWDRNVEHYLRLFEEVLNV